MSRPFQSAAMTLAVAAFFATIALTSAGGQETPTKECLKTGETIGVFYVTKIGGAEKDGVEPGEDVCYRCRFGSSPMVMVFARRFGGNVPRLLKEVDLAIARDKKGKLRGLLTLMGDDGDALRKNGKAIADRSGAKRIPVAIAKDAKTGPANYRLPAGVDVTIIIAKNSQVVSVHTFAVDKIDVAAVMKEVMRTSK